jgi:hypothetical protein
MNNLKYFRKKIEEGMKLSAQTELENANKAPIEPAIDEYHIQLSIADANPSNQSLDSIKAIIDGEEVVIKIPNIK